MTNKDLKLPHHHNDNDEEILSQIPDDDIIETVSSALKHLGDPSRLRIFWILCHTEECVINIAAAVDMTSPAVSHHLKILKSSGLIISQRKGKEMYYKASDSPLSVALRHTMEEIADIYI